MSRLVYARNPDLFDDAVVSVSVSTDAAPGLPLPDELAAMTLPDDLRGAADARRRSFLEGRHCAARALERLAPGRQPAAVVIGAGGAPVWPHGIVGSITHTHGFASAAVAWRTRVRRLGIDAEAVMSDETARAVGPLVARPQEIERVLSATRWPRAVAMTLVFSAKESVFKCLFPSVGRRFDPLDAEVDRVTPSGRDFSVRLLVDLAPTVRAGASLVGHFVVDGGLVHTGVAIGAGDPRDLAE